MHLTISPSSSIRQIIRYLEWSTVGLSTLVYLVPVGTWRVPAECYPQMSGLLAAFLILSWGFPVNRPLWQKQLYLLFGIALALLSRFAGIFMDLFLYLYLAKSYFLLDRNHILLTIIVAGAGSTLVNVLALPAISRVQDWDIAINNAGGVNFVFDALISYLMANIFISLLCCVMIAERKSRQRAEALTHQVETLAATLERTRIARDIHDSLGHTLTRLDMRLAIAQKLRQRDPEQAEQAVDTAKLLANQCIEEVSQALQTLYQSNFDLNQALTTLMEQLSNQSLRVQWEINLPKLSLQTSYQVYCIVKEGIHNIQKHAHASEVVFQAQTTPDHILLELQDNGRGIDSEVPHSGFGLQGMVERTKMLGGKLTINSSHGAGTHIQIVVPL